MAKRSAPAYFNMDTMPAREKEFLGAGWERITFDCPACGAEGVLQIEAHFTCGRADDIVVLTKQCSECNIDVV